ncbi:hypothetical protein QWY93_12620 [Echinicola jeungdonensis]|uniref:Uncharacterized protein n=1 Tax=Echinicola jeungdonensis TaxID=709343 RepID=A0ABV5J917_9BACT|nr:hypothetical protein [Echinicola jeungdonensis]MDN3670169.1 hypothetical protein [Echinicola jeungdonensis]
MNEQETPQDIPSQRLINQQIHASKCGKAKDLLDWMGAIQSQDFVMTKWALGLRAEKESLSKASQKYAISQNGIFRPVIVLDGNIVGIWKRITKKDLMLINTLLIKISHRTPFMK